MSMYFVSRPCDLKGLKNCLPYRVINRGSLRTKFVCQLTDAKTGIFVGDQLMGIRTENALIFPLWAAALYGQGWINEDGILINTGISPADDTNKKVHLIEVGRMVDAFMYSKPVEKPIDCAYLEAGFLTGNVSIGDEIYSFDTLAFKKHMIQHKKFDYSIFAN